MKSTEEQKKEVYRILANNRYAKRPDHISAHRWNAIYAVMWKRYMKEFMATPDGLYTDSEIWKQTFYSYTK